MKPIDSIFNEAIAKIKERGYPNLYVAIDVHGTIFYPSKLTRMEFCDGASSPSEFVYSIGVKSDCAFYPDAYECLKKMSDSKRIKLILWTSTLDTYHLLRTLEWYGIKFDYLNSNPDFKCNEYADFSKKFHFDVLLDDKAGFDAEHDWSKILTVDFGALDENEKYECESENPNS